MNCLWWRLCGQKSGQLLGAESLSPTTGKNWILPTTTWAWMRTPNSRWEHSPAGTYTAGWRDLKQRSQVTGALTHRNCETINVCCFMHQVCGNLLSSDRKLISNTESTASSSFLVRDTLRLLSTKSRLPDTWGLIYEHYGNIASYSFTSVSWFY